MSVDVAVIGGGPAGLTAASALRRAGAGAVVVLDREADAGGIPRHAHHQGYGMRDLKRLLNGPDYARRLVDRAVSEGVDLQLGAQVTGWRDGALEVTAPSGRRTVHARAYVLATGCRERPRSARLVPGARPQGVLTTGMLQQLVYLAGERPGRRAVIVGAEHVAFSALLTLHHGGAETVVMTTEHPRHQSYAAFRLGAAARFRVPLRTRTAVTRILGRRRVEAVELTDRGTGAVEVVPCDTVVFTGDWIPDNELTVLAGAALDPGTRGPQVDDRLRTTRHGLFAAGNVVHAAETADVAALTGAHVTAAVLAHLGGSPWPSTGVPIRCEPPLEWIAPNVVRGVAAKPARGRYLVRARDELHRPRVELVQDGRRLAEVPLRRLGPGRSSSLPVSWTAAVDPGGPPVIARTAPSRRYRR